MKRFYLLLIFGSLAFQSAWAQTETSCTQTLQLAQSTYEQGRLYELPTILENCINSGGFTKEEQVDAYRLLVLTFIYLEEPERADSAMINLLRTDHYFEINEDVDPAEFVGLYRTFRTTPVFSLGAKLGANATFPLAFVNHSIGSEAANKGEYSPLFSFQFGASFEKLLFEKNEDPRWTAAPEILLINQAYGYANESLNLNDETVEPVSNLEATIQQNRIDLNLLVQYRFMESIINPYFLFGPGLSYLSRSPTTLETNFPEEGSVVTGPSLALENTLKRFDITAVAGAGLKFQFGEIFLNADVRVKYGIFNQVRESERFDEQATLDYGYSSNDIRQSAIIANIGFIWPYFNPKKLQ